MRKPLLHSPWTAAALYLLTALTATWPLASVMGSHLPGDLGDPLFNAWILRWTGGHVLRALQGDLPALAQYWHGNIFYPAPLTLAYSEHLTPQMLQALPLLAATGNPILAYNVVLLSTYVLSGLGMFLFVRELTGRPLAALVAGFAFAFAPYRIDQYAHLEVLSSQWMPFALYGLRRYFTTRRLRPLAGASLALLLQGLSCGYYLAYFPPFVVAYCLYEMGARGLLGDLRTWRALAAAAAAVLLLTAAMLWPYARVRQIGDVGVRDRAEVETLSADTHAFATVAWNARLLGPYLRAMPRSQGQGFPGLTVLAFALLACVPVAVRSFLTSRAADVRAPWRRWSAALLVAAVAGQQLLLVYTLITGRLALPLGALTLKFRDHLRLLAQIAICAAAAVAISPFWRRTARAIGGSVEMFFGALALAAAWLSLGPVVHANGHAIGAGLYDILYIGVPGFDGLRVPALNIMLAACFLAVLAGLGAAHLLSWSPSGGRIVVMLAMLAIVAEFWSVPTPTAAPRPVDTPVYRAVRELPDGSVVAEFPFGRMYDEVQYVYASAEHGKPIVNGYSGYYPASYRRLAAALSKAPDDPEAWRALLSSGATHAVVHDAEPIASWLRRSGAQEIGAFGGDRLFRLR